MNDGSVRSMAKNMNMRKSKFAFNVVFIMLFVFLIFVMLVRTLFGIEITDEAYYVAEGRNDKKQEKKLVASYGHSYNALQERFTLNEMEFMDKLPTKYEFEYVGKKIAFFHGRPLDMLEGRFYQDTECAKKEFAPYDVVFLGHTHCKIDRIVGKTRVICPGSLGQPRDGMGYGFAIFNLEDGICQYRNVSVNNKLLRRDIEQKDANLQKLYEVLSREERTDEKVKSIKI